MSETDPRQPTVGSFYYLDAVQDLLKTVELTLVRVLDFGVHERMVTDKDERDAIIDATSAVTRARDAVGEAKEQLAHTFLGSHPSESEEVRR